MADLWTFHDFLIASALDQCYFCGGLDEPPQFVLVYVDEAMHPICGECLESYGWKHSQPEGG